MSTQQFFKGMLMALVAVVVAAFSTTPIDYLLMGIAAVCAILTYTGKNLIAVLHSDSPAGALSLINVASGVLVALGTGLLEGVSMYFINSIIIWGVLWKVVISVTLTYLGSTFFAPPYSIEKKKGLVL